MFTEGLLIALDICELLFLLWFDPLWCPILLCWTGSLWLVLLPLW